MKDQNYSTSILVDKSPNEAYNAINNVRGWWSGLHSEEFEGTTDKLNDEFVFRAGEGAHTTTQRLIELIPDKKIVWLVTDSKLTFVDNQTEWTGTKLCFEISTQGDKTKIVFTHQGLIPEFECYDSCAPSWSQYMHEKLVSWIATSQPAA